MLSVVPLSVVVPPVGKGRVMPSLKVSRTVSELSEMLVQEVERLAAAREAVALDAEIAGTRAAWDAEVKDRKEAFVERAAAEATRQTEQRLEQQIVLLQRDAAADQRVAELQVKAHKNTIARQAAQIEALQRQLDEAKQPA